MTRIACLGWGSLIWDPQQLAVDGEWAINGPIVPVEFLRRSGGGRVTLVLDPSGTPVQSLWALLKSQNVESAIEALRSREKISLSNVSRDIGRWTGGPSPHLIPSMSEWAAQNNLDAVVWTALGYASKAMGERQSAEQVIAYLQTLEGTQRENAERYVRRAPPQIATVYRGKIEAALGWTYSET